MKDYTTSNNQAYSVSPIARSYTSADNLPPYYSQSLHGIPAEDLAKKRSRILIAVVAVAFCMACAGIFFFMQSRTQQVDANAAAAPAPAAAVVAADVQQPNADAAERAAKAREAVKAAEAAAKSAEAAVALAAANAGVTTDLTEEEINAKIAHVARTHAIRLSAEHVFAAFRVANAAVISLENEAKAPVVRKQPVAKKQRVEAEPAPAPAPVQEYRRPVDVGGALPF